MAPEGDAGKPLAKHICNDPKGKASSTIIALKLQKDDPELMDNKGFCGGSPALFQHTQLFSPQKDANP